MKKVIAIAFLVLSAITASAQSLDKDEFYVGAIVQRRNIDVVRDFRVNQLNDSLGVTVEYRHFIGKGKGRVGFGVDYAILFHANQPNKSQVAQQAGHFTVTYQNRDAKRFQPFIKGGIGVARDAFGGVVFTGNKVVGADATRSLIAGGGIDTVLKGRLKWRIGVDYQNTAFGGSQQHNVRVTSGLVF